jgi:hypothetical protein
MKPNIKQFFRDLKEGIISGFPLCCVLHFCFDELMHRQEKRYYRHIYGLGFVPCILHMKAFKQDRDRAKLELLLETGLFIE